MASGLGGDDGSLNPLSPGGCGGKIKSMIFKHIIQNSSLGTHFKIALMWMPQNFTNGKSTLGQVMLWLSAISQQAIIWASVGLDLWCHMALPGHKSSNCINEPIVYFTMKALNKITNDLHTVIPGEASYCRFHQETYIILYSSLFVNRYQTNTCTLLSLLEASY